MLASKTILIVDDNSYMAIDLTDAIENCGGKAAGPVSSLADAVALVDSQSIAGAIVDFDLAEAEAVIGELTNRRIPVAGHSTLPDAKMSGSSGALMRPVLPRDLIDLLTFRMATAPGPTSHYVRKKA